jgi:protein ImuB
MRSRILSLWLPTLPTDRLARRARREGGAGPLADSSQPAATFAAEGSALRLVAVNAAAAAAGLGPGTTLADAQAMIPGLALHPAEPAQDAALLTEIARYCERWTPHVAIDRSCAHDPGGALWLDISGCAHLFGGEAALLAGILERLDRQGFAARAAIAEYPGAAWAVARWGEQRRPIVPPGAALAAVAPLPVAALRLDHELVRMLERLGLGHIECLLPLPRQTLAARFGDLLLTRLDQALGRVVEPISPQPPRHAHQAEINLAEPITHREGLVAVARRLLGELCFGLEASCAGARRLTLALHRVDGTTTAQGVGTSRPTRDARTLFRLLEEKLEQVDPGFGIERAILAATVVEPLLPEPIAWRQMGAGDLDQARDLAPLVDRLANRLGEGAVVRLVPQASHLPERAQRAVPMIGDAAGQAPFPRRGSWGEAPARPLRLLARPEPIEAVAPLPDEPPLLFRWRRAVHRVRSASGPERLAPEWWRDGLAAQDARTRDYFAVEDTEGGRFWLFREGLWQAGAATTPRWYLHGLFA